MTIVELREQKGIYSQEEFAGRLKLALTTVRNAENGHRVNKNTALRIAEELGVRPDEIDDLNYRGKRRMAAIHETAE